MIELSKEDNLSVNTEIAKVIIGALPRKADGVRSTALFMSLPILMKDGRKFRMSMQASDFAYSEPRNVQRSLMDYERIEVAFLDDNGEFVQPSVLGLAAADGDDEKTYHLSNADYDDVLAYIEVTDVVNALAQLFTDGSGLDFENRSTGKILNHVRLRNLNNLSASEDKVLDIDKRLMALELPGKEG